LSRWLLFRVNERLALYEERPPFLSSSFLSSSAFFGSSPFSSSLSGARGDGSVLSSTTM
jgi:hypothetical protein